MTAEARRKEVLSAFRPPAKLALSEWIQSAVFLPSSLAAQPGRMRLWRPQIEIADSIGDDTVERVTILKSARVGATQLMVGALGHFVENDPSPVLCVVPVDSDARHLVTSVIEPTFQESPDLRAALTTDKGGRDTMLHRHFAGGSLSVIAARSPRALRARTARILFADELDAWEATAEGDPLELAIMRTHTFGNRKIVLASTPIDADTSRIVRSYDQSDQRVFVVPCPGCDELHEILWRDIKWPADKPEEAYWACPSCGSVVEDRQKPQMVAQGRWIATAPHVEGQVRGISQLAPILLTVNELDQALDAMLVGLKTSAMFAGFVTDMTNMGGAGEAFPDGLADISLEPGVVRVLPGGTDIKFSAPDQARESIAFAKLTLGQIAAGLGVPQHLVDGDLTQANYSSLRAGLLPFRAKVEQYVYHTLVPQFLNPIHDRFITGEYLAGRLDVPDLSAALKVEWLPPRPMQVDPQKDMAAAREALAMGLTSRRQAVAAMGWNVAELDQEIADDRARETALGLSFEAKESTDG